MNFQYSEKEIVQNINKFACVSGPCIESNLVNEIMQDNIIYGISPEEFFCIILDI